MLEQNSSRPAVGVTALHSALLGSTAVYVRRLVVFQFLNNSIRNQRGARVFHNHLTWRVDF